MTINEKRDRIAYMRHRAGQLNDTWATIMEDPMNLNSLMVHIGLVTGSVDEMLNELANMMEESLSE